MFNFYFELISAKKKGIVLGSSKKVQIGFLSRDFDPKMAGVCNEMQRNPLNFF